MAMASWHRSTVAPNTRLQPSISPCVHPCTHPPCVHPCTHTHTHAFTPMHSLCSPALVGIKPMHTEQHAVFASYQSLTGAASPFPARVQPSPCPLLFTSFITLLCAVLPMRRELLYIPPLCFSAFIQPDGRPPVRQVSLSLSYHFTCKVSDARNSEAQLQHRPAVISVRGQACGGGAAKMRAGGGECRPCHQRPSRRLLLPPPSISPVANLLPSQASRLQHAQPADLAEVYKLKSPQATLAPQRASQAVHLIAIKLAAAERGHWSCSELLLIAGRPPLWAS